jgi:Na+-transporting NADH:ubiquinone oxidoreductase subunit A
LLEFSSVSSCLILLTNIFATAFDSQVLIINMSKNIKLKRGFDINLVGKPEKKLVDLSQPETVAIKPTDFHHVTRPKLLVAEGDNVKAGTPIFYEKTMEEVMFCSPVSGEVVEIKRGAKRKILEIRILADKEVDSLKFTKYSSSDIANLSREDVVKHMVAHGAWPQVIQRPYGVVANPSQTPKSIFVSGFDSHPNAPDTAFLLQGNEAHFQTGLSILSKLTDGDVNLGLDNNAEVAQVFANVQGVKVNRFSGPHPAGNVGVQIHHIDPIGKGDLIWTVSPYGVAQIGKLFGEGIFDASKIIAITGSEVKSPAYVRMYTGACANKLAEEMVKEGNNRIISGNVLTGQAVGREGYLGYYDNQVSVIPEGDYEELFGWILPSTKKLSFHRTLGMLSFLNKNKEYTVDTNLHGEHRNFVITGTFEQVMPMDVLPMYLFKAIMTEDYEGMEALGILEVIEEDVALCEFIDVSKNELQSVLREGIELVRNS